MNGAGAVRLRWSSHQTTVMSAVDNFFEDESLVDVTLSCEGQTLQAHKLILSACSPYLKQLLDTKERVDPIIFFTGVKFAHLNALIQFIYRGEVNISQEHLPSFLTLAEDLQIRGLANQGDSSTESATQRIRSTILETNNSSISNSKVTNSTKPKPIRKVGKHLVGKSSTPPHPPPPPLKKARSSIASDDDQSIPDEFQNGLVSQNSDSIDSGNFLSPEEELQYEAIAIENSEDEQCDGETIVGDQLDTDATDGAGTEDDVKPGRTKLDWKQLLKEEDSNEQLSISDPDQEAMGWQFADGENESIEMTLDDDEEDEIQGMPSSSRNSSGNDIEPTACPLCNKQFQKRKTWNTHCLYDCPMVPPKYSCPNCPYRARRGYQLKIHCLKIHGIIT